MDGDRKEGKEYFQINLDTARIFWISFVFSLILIGVFLLGFYTAGGRIKEFLGGGKENQVKIEKPAVEKVEVPEAPQPEASTEAGKTKPDEDLINLITEEFKTRTEVIDVEGATEGGKIHADSGSVVSQPIKTNTGKTASSVSKAKTSFPTTSSRKPATVSRYVYRPVGDYFIQVASFMKKDNAERFAEKLRKDRYRVQIIETEIEGKKFYRVRVGPFEKKSIARNTMIAMKRLYNLTDAYVVKQK